MKEVMPVGKYVIWLQQQLEAYEFAECEELILVDTDTRDVDEAISQLLEEVKDLGYGSYVVSREKLTKLVEDTDIASELLEAYRTYVEALETDTFYWEDMQAFLEKYEDELKEEE